VDASDAPGRSCPVTYRYSPTVFQRPAEIEAETLYVIGGLYGNPFALDAVDELAAGEQVFPTLVFNGDFNWFNVDAEGFAQLNARVLAHVALRGNVETELATDDERAGCGCAYPEWVGDAEVARSNEIAARLRGTARALPALREQLGRLPMHAVAVVGGIRVGIVHGDAWALAGWQFSQERLADDLAAAASACDEAEVGIFACSHTCLPVLQVLATARGRCMIANNGAAGMPNFHGTRFGLITRISTRPRADALYGERLGPVYVDAVAARYDHERWLAHFDAAWPAGSAAAVSYRQRIADGPAYEPHQAVRGHVRQALAPRPTATTA